MNKALVLVLTFIGLNSYAQPNCSKEAASLAADEYANDNFGGNSEDKVTVITAKDGSKYYQVIATGEYGAKTYTVIFDDPSSCATDTARVFEKKK